MIILYDDPISGNGYKVRLLLAQLEIEHELIELDILKGETRTSKFKKLNPHGKIPTIALEDGRSVWESNAILIYLASGTPLWPADKFGQADVSKWLFFEQYSHEPNIAVAHSMLHKPGRVNQKVLAEKHKKGYEALDVMEYQLKRYPFLASGTYSIADISLYAYTHLAENAEFDLSKYSAVNDWLVRVASEPGHVPMGGSLDEA